jgi:hypothetical protein
VHRKLLGDIAPIANDLSTFTFGFAEAIFIKYFGDLTAALVAEIKDAPNIEDLRLPWFVETTCFCRLIRLLNVRFSISMAFRSASGRCPCRRAGRMSLLHCGSVPDRHCGGATAKGAKLRAARGAVAGEALSIDRSCRRGPCRACTRAPNLFADPGISRERGSADATSRAGVATLCIPDDFRYWP